MDSTDELSQYNAQQQSADIPVNNNRVESNKAPDSDGCQFWLAFTDMGKDKSTQNSPGNFNGYKVTGFQNFV